MKSSMALLLLVATAILGLTAASDPAPLKVVTPSGTTIGHYATADNGLQVRRFFGMPYAHPPIGEDRWKPARMPYMWDGELVANKSGAACPQLIDGNEPLITGESSEDCLFINVITPTHPKNASLPVYVYLYGGSFMNGDTSVYSETGIGNALAADQDMIFVALNYRLGIFGYLSLPELAAEDPSFPSSGNYGQQDQRAGFQWVQDNIAAFGGDPTKVTISGESAGAISILGHLTSLKTPTGLFRNAYVESGSPSGAKFALKKNADANGDFFKRAVFTLLASKFYTGPVINSTGCTSSASLTLQLQCLRQVRWVDMIGLKELMKMNDTGVQTTFKEFLNGFDWGPVIDSYEWDELPLQMAQQGQITPNVSVLMGNVKDEGTLFLIPVLPKKITTLEVDGLLAAVWSLLGHGFQPAQGWNALKLYHPSQYKPEYGQWGLQNWAALANLGGDGLLTCPCREFERALVAHGVPTYVYEFNKPPGCWTSAYPLITENVKYLGAFHESDFPYTFNLTSVLGRKINVCNATSTYDPYQFIQCGPAITFPGSDNCKTDPAVRHDIFNYLTSFAKLSDPNFAGAVHWPQFNQKEDRLLVGNTTSMLPGPFDSDVCDFWKPIDTNALYQLLMKLIG